MAVAVMGVGIMRVRMHQQFVAMRMAVRFVGWVGGRMLMLMMFIMMMHVFMLHCLMRVDVRMPFGQVQPHANRHQESRCP